MQETQETQVQSPGWEDLEEEMAGNLLQYSCLEDSMDRGAWWAAVYGVARGRARLSTCTGTVPQAYQQELLSSPSGS